MVCELFVDNLFHENPYIYTFIFSVYFLMRINAIDAVDNNIISSEFPSWLYNTNIKYVLACTTAL